jgi:hypothetical protein
MGKKSGSGSGIRIRDEQPGLYFLGLRNHFFFVKIIKFFDADPDPGPGMGKVGSGSGINIPDTQPPVSVL